MFDQVPPSTAAAQLELECAARILIQASMAPLIPACKLNLEAGELQALVAEHDNNSLQAIKQAANRKPLLAINSDTTPAVNAKKKRALKAASVVSTGEYLQKSTALPANTRTFPDQESFETWAIDQLCASHPEAVIEKKRSAKTTTISCRNRRNPSTLSGSGGGTACPWMLKATYKEEEDAPVRWEVNHDVQEHNEECLQRMNNKKRERSTTVEPKSMPSAHKARQASSAPTVRTKKRTIHISDESESETETEEESEEEDETPKELRKRKANHPGNALPSRARRYRL